MKKLIIKTTVITLIIIFAVTFLVFWLLSLFKPSVIADTAFRFNNKSVCVTYSEKQYEKTKRIDDLAILTDRAVWAKDYELTVKYANLLLNHGDFDSYSQNKNGYETYLACSLVEALYLTNAKEKFIEVAFSYYTGESQTNTVRIAILTAKNDIETLNAILDKLRAFENKTEETNYLINEILKLKGE